jgi:hypothetical protein
MHAGHQRQRAGGIALRAARKHAVQDQRLQHEQHQREEHPNAHHRVRTRTGRCP